MYIARYPPFPANYSLVPGEGTDRQTDQQIEQQTNRQTNR